MGALLFALTVAAPPVPTLLAPIDGGWAARAPAIQWALPSNTSLETVGAELQFFDDLGGDAGFAFAPRSGTGGQTFTGPSLPDASFYTWRARGIDDAGLVSAWSATGSFIVDDLAPAIPTFFTADLDGGLLVMTTSATTDTQSGLGYYHFGLSRLDVLDGSINYGGTQNLQPAVPNVAVLIGPGAYLAGVHVHDVVGNAFVAQSLTSPLLTVTASASLPVPQPPEVIRGDGGTYATFPYVPQTFVRFRVDAGGATPLVGFALTRRGRTETDWETCDFGAGPTIGQTMPAGDQDVRVATITANGVSDWSAPVRVFVDATAPNTPNVTPSVDAGEVLLSWPSTRDNFQGSGVLEYRVSRCCVADASIAFANVPHTPDASITFLETPGFGAWTYAVTAVDRAGNAGLAWQGLVPLPPNAPRGLRATATVTNQPIALAWDDERDGGFVARWSVTRIDGADAGTPLAADLGMPALLDDAPEGAWSYEVTTTVAGLRSPVARLDGVVRDVTPPVVSAPQLNRVGARTAEVTFTAQDALAGLASVRLERDGVDLGPVTSPFTDTPPQDGVHHYRVVASDLAGNVATSADSADFVTPGMGLVITVVDPQPVTCGEAFELTLSASEPASWSLVTAPPGVGLDEASGTLTWTPTAADVGSQAVRVRAQGASSFDVRDVTLEVTCDRTRLSVGCGCSGLDGALVALAAGALLRRRRAQ
ncbi:MAG: hypothetical protein U0228_30610 [Myxococcaceae bacterium]